ncbi:putative splicing factor, arginine/serine-rich 2 [Caenorhabditis elegans]|uniref:Probable splicing factor, arginine/serine-rich 2 n=1 Tax=Caenorhabditis elegans TaxID=6239 RepID=RSP2_CAEEL|nr:putative splicing factor, arginine/serine-rich 2 [Caenorhabditis elegans]Q23120.1 RecName: Full=Probable splicing factor, arginine/serine-rich 2; AltName: Full=CeSRp40; AltName: Full=RNA-binding protein srp-4 [Caenorhabditis elegans]CAA91394.1 Probable splicing factor, arginine/serine-rich 2 [Caenorhabditis elegans]|eukprot:NP_496441.1 Probable splicing factor, arginine/serine-rich 2 [Caenorhabditis elegans]
MVRVYIGRLPNRASDRDVEHFFRGYGKLSDVIMKNGFGFVDFQDQRDADDAVHDLNGKELCGERVILEFPRRKVGYNEERSGSGFRGREPTFRKGGERQFSNRYSRPCSTRFRLVIDNLSTRYSWQDIKDHIRKLGIEPTYSEAHKRNVNQAIVCFTSHDDLRDAMNKLQGEDLNGRKLKCTDETRDRSRSRSPRRRSRSRSPTRSRSPPARRRSPGSDRSDRKSRSASPKKRSDKRARSESKSRSRSGGRRSRSNSPPNRSPSPKKRRDNSSPRSGSASP